MQNDCRGSKEVKQKQTKLIRRDYDIMTDF